MISRTCSPSGAMPARTEIFAEGRRKHRLDNVGDWSTSTGDYNTREPYVKLVSCLASCVALGQLQQAG